MDDPWLALGLGNPGGRYETSPHNAGARAVERLAAKLGVTLRPSRAPALVADGETEGVRLLVARTTTYMNESGRAAEMLTRWFPIEVERLIVVHDEIDLPAGTLRLKFGGGTAGHHGLDSIEAALDTPDFYRVRIGVGRPSGSKDTVDWLLDSLPRRLLEELAVLEEEAAESVLSIIHDGLDRAMNRFNTRSSRNEEESPTGNAAAPKGPDPPPEEATQR